MVIKKMLTVLLVISLIMPTAAFAYSYNHVFENVPPVIQQWGSPLPTWAQVTSKWNQPRQVSSGSNPHQGIDLYANIGTRVNAVESGSMMHLSYGYPLGVSLQVNTSPAYYVHYYHLETWEPAGYYYKGQKIATSGYYQQPSDAHLHFGGVTTNVESSRKWYRNEVNYRWTTAWNSGKDVDSYAVVGWWNNVASITAYFLTGSNPIFPGEVRIFHRRAGTSPWTDGGTMTHVGDHCYTYDFTGRYPQGTDIDWLVRIKRNGLTVYSYCWAPSKYDQPDPNPNNVATPYPYYRNRVQ